MRVVIAEDETLLRQGLQMLLADAGIDVVDVVGDAESLLAAVDRAGPDLVITDIRMPPHNLDDGLRAAINIRQIHPKTGVMVLSQYVQRNYAEELLAAKATGIGYLLKQRIADVEQFCADLANVAAGGTVLDPEVVSIMLSRASKTVPSMEHLTERQTEVLAHLAEGRSNRAIAAQLHISERAVVSHISNIYETLGIPVHDDDHRRVLAVLRFLSE